MNNVVEMHAHAPRPARNKVMPGVFQTDRARRRAMPSQSPKAAALMASITPRQIAPTLLPEMAGQSHFVPADPSLALDIPDDEARLPAGWFLLPALFLSLFLWAALIYWIAF